MPNTEIKVQNVTIRQFSYAKPLGNEKQEEVQLAFSLRVDKKAECDAFIALLKQAIKDVEATRDSIE